MDAPQRSMPNALFFESHRARTDFGCDSNMKVRHEHVQQRLTNVKCFSRNALTCQYSRPQVAADKKRPSCYSSGTRGLCRSSSEIYNSA